MFQPSPQEMTADTPHCGRADAHAQTEDELTAITEQTTMDVPAIFNESLLNSDDGRSSNPQMDDPTDPIFGYEPPLDSETKLLLPITSKSTPSLSPIRENNAGEDFATSRSERAASLPPPPRGWTPDGGATPSPRWFLKSSPGFTQLTVMDDQSDEDDDVELLIRSTTVTLLVDQNPPTEPEAEDDEEDESLVSDVLDLTLDLSKLSDGSDTRRQGNKPRRARRHISTWSFDQPQQTYLDDVIAPIQGQGDELLMTSDEDDDDTSDEDLLLESSLTPRPPSLLYSPTKSEEIPNAGSAVHCGGGGWQNGHNLMISHELNYSAYLPQSLRHTFGFKKKSCISKKIFLGNT